MPQIPAEFPALIHRLADASGALIRKYFRNISFENKEDETPVTAADRGAEEVIRALLKKERPHDGVWGEEFGAENMEAEWSWVIDPIDGTKSFIRGMPIFATLIALQHKGIPVLGLIDQPILKERWAGGIGIPAAMNGKTVRTRPCARLSDAILNATAPGMFYGKNWGDNGRRFEPLADACKYSLWGGDAYAYGLLSSGFIDVQVDTQLKLHDWAALVPVIEAAGGKLTGWQGETLTLKSDGRVIAVGDARLLEPALRYLRG
jgi:inositol-phosphate phosphatase/L-galactose 1-phosphate phosphatase/histidinol-phosphatase